MKKFKRPWIAIHEDAWMILVHVGIICMVMLLMLVKGV
jgi:hypothetical protein